jgi:hypothetical protein
LGDFFASASGRPGWRQKSTTFLSTNFFYHSNRRLDFILDCCAKKGASFPSFFPWKTPP